MRRAAARFNSRLDARAYFKAAPSLNGSYNLSAYVVDGNDPDNLAFTTYGDPLRIQLGTNVVRMAYNVLTLGGPNPLPPTWTDATLRIEFSKPLSAAAQERVRAAIVNLDALSGITQQEIDDQLFTVSFDADNPDRAEIRNETDHDVYFPHDIYARIDDDQNAPEVKLLDPEPFEAGILAMDGPTVNELSIAFSNNVTDAVYGTTDVGALIDSGTYAVYETQNVTSLTFSGAYWNRDFDGKPVLHLVLAAPITDFDPYSSQLAVRFKYHAIENEEGEWISDQDDIIYQITY